MCVCVCVCVCVYRSLHSRIKGGVKGVPGIQTQQAGVWGWGLGMRCGGMWGGLGGGGGSLHSRIKVGGKGVPGIQTQQVGVW